MHGLSLEKTDSPSLNSHCFSPVLQVMMSPCEISCNMLLCQLIWSLFICHLQAIIFLRFHGSILLFCLEVAILQQLLLLFLVLCPYFHSVSESGRYLFYRWERQGHLFSSFSPAVYFCSSLCLLLKGFHLLIFFINFVSL